jgi:signal transduction histidine kinase
MWAEGAMPNLLDYGTLLTASGIVAGALLMLLAMQVRTPYPGFLRLVLAMDILAAAFIIGGLKGYAPDSIWILQFTGLATFGLIDNGLRTFCGLPHRGRWSLLYVPVGMALQLFLHFTQPLYLSIVATSLLIVPIALDVAVQLLRAEPPKGRWFGYRFVAAVALLTCLTAVVRLVAIALVRHEASPYFSTSIGNTAFFLLVLILVVTLSFGITTLAHERLVADVKAEHEQRMRIQNQLAEAERAATVGRMVAGVAHFFNNQMAVIQLACPLLHDAVGASNATVAPLAEAIDTASKRASNITGRLQQYARSKILRSSSFDPIQLLDAIIPDVRAAAGEMVEVVTSRSSHVSAVQLDPDLLKDAMLVLTRNAKDAMPAGGKLTISVREEVVDPPQAEQLSLSPGTFVLTSVTDTGHGMDNETQRHLFEPFFTTRGLGNAEGLGLASAYGFIRQSGGTIVFSSKLEEGSKFELYLPTASTSPTTVSA